VRIKKGWDMRRRGGKDSPQPSICHPCLLLNTLADPRCSSKTEEESRIESGFYIFLSACTTSSYADMDRFSTDVFRRKTGWVGSSARCGSRVSVLQRSGRFWPLQPLRKLLTFAFSPCCDQDEWQRNRACNSQRISCVNLMARVPDSRDRIVL